MAIVLGLALGGCAGLAPDGGRGRVADLVRERLGHELPAADTERARSAARQRAAELLARPLQPEGAAELALIDNRELQARLDELGIADADRAQAGRLRNPLWSFDRLAGGGALEIDRSVMVDLLGLLALPARSRLARDAFERAQLQAASQVVETAGEAREAWFEAVAADQLATYAQQVSSTAEAADDLARGMLQAGTLSRLDEMRRHVFQAEAATQLAHARQQSLAARERLVRALGLDDDAAKRLQLPDRLPGVPGDVAGIEAAERAVLDRRLDVLIARRDEGAAAREVGLPATAAAFEGLEAGWQQKTQRGAPDERGFGLQVPVPLFDAGDAARSRAQARYRMAADHAAAVAAQAQSQVREAHAAYLAAHEVARRYHDDIVPLRGQIARENLLRYNGMLIDVFELLAESRQQVQAVVEGVQAERDFWIAQGRLEAALAVPVPIAATPRAPEAPGDAGHGAAGEGTK